MKHETEDSPNMSDETTKTDERVPFSNSTNVNRQTDSEKTKSQILKENTKSVGTSPKSSSEDECSRPTTPVQKEESDEIAAPLTPTSNLKMLFSAVSPEIRHRESKMRDISIGTDTDDIDVEGCDDNVSIEIVEPPDMGDDCDWKPVGSRKEKSLGLLCAKFLSKYPEQPERFDKHVISLDEVAKDLGVERRRIYDIVNVLESVEIVSRIAKNKYAWHGKSNMAVTLSKLKALGEVEGFAEQMTKLREYELNREIAEQTAAMTGKQLEKPALPIENLGGTALMRKDKSLGIMSQKFLMLFLVCEQKTVNLDLAAKILIGDANVDRSDYSKFKTKIRRLYDIANILTSLDLIRKVHVTEFRGRKPAFKYVGPEIVKMNDVSVCYSDGYHRPSSRHSLLDCVKNAQAAGKRSSETQTGYDKLKKSNVCSCGDKKSSANCPCKPNKKNASFPRHSSFEQICEVAAQERQKLYESTSQPNSPTQEMSGDEYSKSLSQGDTPTASPIKRKTCGKKIILQHVNGSKISEDTPKGKKSEAIIIKTGIPASKNPTMIPLTKDQIDAVLKSLKVPVPLKNDKNGGDDSEGSESEKCEGSEKRPATDSEAEPLPKKFKADFPSPPSDEGEVMPIIENEMTPRALYTRSEFVRPTTIEESSTNDSEMPAVPVSENQEVNYDQVTTECNTQVTSAAVAEMVGKVLQSSQSNVQSIAVQLPNQSPRIIQFPVVSMDSSAMDIQQPQVQIIQGMPVSATGRNGQPINFMVPLTFSPPLTPDSSQQSLFSFPSSTHQQVTTVVTQIHGSGAAGQVKKAITIPKFVTPTERPVTTQFYRSTPGGLVPLTSEEVKMISKDTPPSTAVRKLDLPDISL